MESIAINLAKAFSSGVTPTSCGAVAEPVTANNGFAREDAREIRRKAPFLRPRRFNARATAKLHQTIDRQSNVPARRKKKILFQFDIVRVYQSGY